MVNEKADRLRVDCLLSKPRWYDWSQGYIDKWEVIQPFVYDDFSEESQGKNEEKTGYYDFDTMELNNAPMMNYLYPLKVTGHSFGMEDAKKLNGLNLCLVYFLDEEESDAYALALTGGGMDLSWDICQGYIRLGFYPPVHFRLPNFAGMRKTKGREAVIDACVKGREIVKTWMDGDIRDLEHVRDCLSPLEMANYKIGVEDHVWERCEICSRRTHPNEIELYKGMCADCALGGESKA